MASLYIPADDTDGERLELCSTAWHLAIFLPLDDTAGGERLGLVSPNVPTPKLGR